MNSEASRHFRPQPLSTTLTIIDAAIAFGRRDAPKGARRTDFKPMKKTAAPRRHGRRLFRQRGILFDLTQCPSGGSAPPLHLGQGWSFSNSHLPFAPAARSNRANVMIKGPPTGCVCLPPLTRWAAYRKGSPALRRASFLRTPAGRTAVLKWSAH